MIFRSKYKNKIVEIDGIKFDSIKESKRYAQLKWLELGNVINDLKLQVEFILIPSVIIAGRKKPALKYIADFTYIENGNLVVNDVKGMLTDVYKIKRHLMKFLHDIDILET